MLMPETFKQLCPKGVATIQELSTIAKNEGREEEVEDILSNDDKDSIEKEADLRDLVADLEGFIRIGGVVYRFDEVEQFVDQWVKHLFRVGLTIDPPDEIGDLHDHMIEYMEELGQDGISDELMAKAFKNAIERCGS